MHTAMTQQQAYELLKQYNKDPFHLRHARTVEGTMRYFARELGYGEEEDFWGIVGLLHDLDFGRTLPGRTASVKRRRSRR